MGYSIKDECIEHTIEIKAEDFCEECGGLSPYGRICSDCRKIPVTFADGIEDG